MKLLLLLAVLAVAYMLWRNARIGTRRDAPPPPAPPALPQEMVACEVCGLHLPRSDAVHGQDGRHFCSQEHRLHAGG